MALEIDGNVVDAVQRALERNGVLQNIRAQLRIQVLDILQQTKNKEVKIDPQLQVDEKNSKIFSTNI